MTAAQAQSAAPVDLRPFIIADADTGHGGDAHVRNLIRRFVEVGIPGYHIEDQKPGVKKCGHQGGKVLVAEHEQIQRLNAARFQLDIMRVPGIIVARTDAEAASLLDNASDERDQPFILGVTNTRVPAYKAAYIAILQTLVESGIDEIRGHLMFAVPQSELVPARAWLADTGLSRVIHTHAEAFRENKFASVDSMLDKLTTRFVDVWQDAADLGTYGESVANAMAFRAGQGETFGISVEEWLAFARRASFHAAREKARSMGIDVEWDCERAKTPEGYYQVQGSLDYAIAKSLAAAPFADLLWMETSTANLTEAAEFGDAIHAVLPDKMLAYNLSPSFNWDTTGMTEDEMRQFPEELGKLGFVFNFITYGGHQIDGLAAEEFAASLRQEGMLALARLQRKFRLLESPYRTPQTLVGGQRLDAALMACSGRTATTKAMGKGSTQHQHLVQTEVPLRLLEDWLRLWAESCGVQMKLRALLQPVSAGSELLELSVWNEADDKLLNVVFADIQDRRGHRILSARDQNNYNPALRQKRIFRDVKAEAGLIIVAEVNADRVAELLNPDHVAIRDFLRRGRAQAAPER